ncbi:hypothetical protein OQA88_4578 [Cercophora sp. LCS_1]
MQAGNIVKAKFPNTTCIFRAIALREPLKKELDPFLDLEHNRPDAPRQWPVRTARVQAHIDNVFRELLINLDNQTIASEEILHGRHSHIDAADTQKVQDACLAHPKVQEYISALQLPPEATVVVEPWTYAPDGTNDISQLLTMCWFYMRLSPNPDSNFYAYPLDIAAEMSTSTCQLLKMHILPSDSAVFPLSTMPSSASSPTPADALPPPFDRRKIHTTSEYYPSLLPPPRTTTKPLHITQPDGPSFSVSGSQITWEKFTLRIGFNHREGLTLHDIRFANRPLFHRISLSEMFVPYGDPRFPYPRKAAFDLGNDGAGLCANNLQLGCDCVGHVKYFDGWVTTQSGLPLKLPNVICCHEVDDGILWKHTNTRTGNAVVARSRVLVLQTIITASNYEYIFAFHLSQDASIHYEVRATGILSTTPIPLDTTLPFGTVVAPGVFAPFHQHLYVLSDFMSYISHFISYHQSPHYLPPPLGSFILTLNTASFCLRIHPSLSPTMTLVQTESLPLPPGPTNPFGVGYTTHSTPIPTASGHSLSHTTNRTFRIHASNHNPTTKTPQGYSLIPHYSPLLLAHPSSHHYQRAEYARHAVWVTKHHDDEFFPAGRFTNQSAGGEGIASWVARGENVQDEDIVVWHTFGSTHNPRIEDWPVMPCEKMVVGLKAWNMFQGNLTMDVDTKRGRGFLV